ncbi:MAG TPA: hypothetical protein VK481_02860 [Gemmatimonadaceae bacterium]|nr:hypothetical protein [Gemmatimonadaceae bacterium]
MSSQQEINDSEWGNPANWRGGLFYFSRRDSRVWIPKRVPEMGMTLNLARPLGFAFLVIPLVLIVALIVTAALGY